ncbi:MAG: DUF2079 domain-containing protein [bacterium]
MIRQKAREWSCFVREHHVAVWLCVLAVMMYLSLMVYRYLHLAYTDWDTAFYAQSMWNLSRGEAFSSLFDFNFFGNHAEFFDVLLVPLFMLFRHPLLLPGVEIILFGLSAWLLYVMTARDLGKVPALLMTATYVIFPANFFAMCHDVNSEAFSPFFLLITIVAYRHKNIIGFYAGLLCLLLMKQNMPLVVMMLGVWGLMAGDRSRVRWGLIPFIVALAYFSVLIMWVIPYFHGGGEYPLWHRFRGDGACASLAAVLFSEDNIKYLIALFGVLLLPAVLSPSLLLLIAPVVAYHLLSSHPPEKTIYYYYGAMLTPAIFLAAVQTVARLKSSMVLRTAITGFFLGITVLQLYSYAPRLMAKVGLDAAPEVMDQWALVQAIPADAAVIATFKFLPPLALRSGLYSFHKVYDRKCQDPEQMKQSDFNTRRIFTVPPNVKYALVDFNDRWLRTCLEQDPAYVEAKLREFFNNWDRVASSGSAVLFRRY